MRPISVLLTNNALDVRGGSETYVRDVAMALLARGHRPTVFSLVLGAVAAELRQATVPVVDDLTRLGAAPDIIHGHHHFETLIAALAFPASPVVNFCHGWVPWEEMPLHHPAVRRYVAVDEVCVDRLVREEGIAPSRVELLLNFVDLHRFRPRPALPPRPARALVLSNAATPDGYVRVIGEACRAAGMSVDIVGAKAGNPSRTPEVLLPAYDLVFAKGRTALEALAVGCATVLADAVGAGPLVTPDNYAALRARNFGIRELRQGHDASWYSAQIARYDAQHATEVSRRVRAEAGLEPAIDRLLEVYGVAMATPPAPGDSWRAAAQHCCRIAPRLKHGEETAFRLHMLTIELESIRAGLAEESEARRVDARLMTERLDESAEALAREQEEGRALRRQVEAYQKLPSLRLRDAALRTPVLGRTLRAGARRLASLLRP